MNRARFLTALLACVLLLQAPLAAAELGPGDPAPRLDIALLDGKVLTEKSLAGKVVLHMYWATWCPICVRELPEVQRLYSAYRERGVEIVAISIDSDPRDAEDYFDAKRYTMPLATRTDPLKQAYGRILGTPTYYLIDRKGTIRVRRVGAFPPGGLEHELKRLL